MIHPSGNCNIQCQHTVDLTVPSSRSSYLTKVLYTRCPGMYLKRDCATEYVDDFFVVNPNTALYTYATLIFILYTYVHKTRFEIRLTCFRLFTQKQHKCNTRDGRPRESDPVREFFLLEVVFYLDCLKRWGVVIFTSVENLW